MLLNVAIDGPAGSGKSTVAKAVAEKIGATYLDTGAMYRMVTLDALNKDISFEDDNKIKEILDDISIVFKGHELFLNGKNVTEAIRSNEVANYVSKIAAIPMVRLKLVAMQRAIAKGQNIVMDGRDIGTHVLPDANFKFFLVASVEERAKRRMKDFINQNIKISMVDLIADIKKRDHQDTTREVSPLKQAHDAILLDTTFMSLNEVIDFIVKEIHS